jgi:hypothetical protein
MAPRISANPTIDILTAATANPCSRKNQAFLQFNRHDANHTVFA